jgi:hypothetical protein
MGLNLVWEEPPAAENNRARGREADRAVDLLKRNPGRWARVEEGTTNASATIKWKKRGCEAVVRTLPKEEGQKGHRYNVYARWPEPLPEESDEMKARERAKAATQQELAAAYAAKHGAALAPRPQQLAEEQQVDQAWRARLTGKKAAR